MNKLNNNNNIKDEVIKNIMNLENIANTGKALGKSSWNSIKAVGKHVKNNAKVYVMLSSMGVGARVAKAQPGYLEVENNLNSSQRHVNVYRDDSLYPGATDNYDYGYDSSAQDNFANPTKCYSDINDPNYGIMHLWDDFRAEDSNAPYDIKFAYEGELSETKENWIKCAYFWNEDGDREFGNAPITFQQTSSANDPTGEGFYPVYDVRDANELNNGVIPLADVPAGTYGQWSPYGDGQLDIGSRLLADLNDNGIVNGEDYALFADGWHTDLDNHIANISGPNGIPDFNSVSGKAIVDYWDLGRFGEGWLRDVNDPCSW